MATARRPSDDGSRQTGSSTINRGTGQAASVLVCDAAAVDADTNRRLLVDQTSLLFAHAPLALATAFGVAVVACIVLWQVTPPRMLLGWLVAVFALTTIRLLLVRRFHQRKNLSEASPGWRHWYVLGCFLSGALWGGLMLLLDLSWPVEQQVFLLFTLAGVTAGAISSHTVIYSAYVMFLLPAVLPVAFYLVSMADRVHTPMGLLLFLYAVAVLIIARHHHDAVKRSLTLGLEKQALARQLAEVNDKLHQENGEKQQALIELRREQRLFLEGPVVAFRWRAVDGWPIDYVSQTVSQFGYDAAQLMSEGVHFFDLIHPDDRERVLNAEFRVGAFSGQPVAELDYRLILPDGSVRWVYDYTIPAESKDGRVECYDGYLIDITGRKRAEQALLEEKERAQVTLHSIGDGVIRADSDDRVQYMNPAAEQLTGWPLAEARGRPVDEVFRLAAEQVAPGVCRDSERGRIRAAIGDQLLRRRDGVRLYGKSQRSPILDSGGRTLGAVIVFSDVTRQRKLAERICYQASHDPLTGLINRREFEWAVDAALTDARQQGRTHCVCYLDLDQFKVINDTCGHVAGDELLRQLAEGLPGLLGQNDTCARLGGDEFGILLEDCGAEKALAVAEKIRAFARDTRFVWGDQVFGVGASIGVVEVSPEYGSVGAILSAADIACYAAKELGRDQVHIYQGADSEPGKRHSEIQLVSRITRALEEDRLVLYYQDIRALGDAAREERFGEVLVRMLDESGELVSPALFLPAAERFNLMSSIDLWVLERTFAWLAEQAGNGERSLLSINLSGQSLGNTHFCDDVLALFERYPVPGERICFEITETAAIGNFAAASRFISRLRARGCRFALDDFGSGLSSFSYLKHLHVDFLKIDGSFVRDIADEPINREMVKSIHQLGRVLGICTIAEFVENDAILQHLVDMGIDYAQGYGIEPPRPLADIC